MSYATNTTPSTTNLLSGSIQPDELDDLEAQVGPQTSSSPNVNGNGNVGGVQSGRIQGIQGGQTGGGSGGVWESGKQVWRESSHPVALLFLYLFRSLALAIYVLCGWFATPYVFSVVLVVTLLSADFWTVRNVSGRVLVGLRFWNQVDEDGSSYWVFESRDPSQPANALDSRLFWTAMYFFPAAWIILLLWAVIRFEVSFIPIVALALVFNLTNTIGYTYADRDAKQKWATGMVGSNMFGNLGGLGGSMVSGLVKTGLGRVLG